MKLFHNKYNTTHILRNRILQTEVTILEYVPPSCWGVSQSPLFALLESSYITFLVWHPHANAMPMTKPSLSKDATASQYFSLA